MDNKTVALDIGGVCLRVSVVASAEFFGWNLDAVPAAAMELADRLERGLATDAECVETMRQITGGRFSDRDIVHGWNLAIDGEIPGMAEWAESAVARGCRLVFLSDTSGIHLREVRRKLSFAHLVTGGVFSFEVGAKKPAAAMYAAFEKSHGRPLIYIDDRAENIAAAAARGWNVHHFNGIEPMLLDFAAALAGIDQ